MDLRCGSSWIPSSRSMGSGLPGRWRGSCAHKALNAARDPGREEHDHGDQDDAEDAHPMRGQLAQHVLEQEVDERAGRRPPQSLGAVSKIEPQVDFLQGDFGRAVLEEYQGRMKADYNNARALNVLSSSDNLIVGSNPFAVVLVNQIIRGQGLRTATPAELERVLRVNALSLEGTYEDSVLVLRTAS